MEDLLQKIIDLLEDYKKKINKEERHRWTIVYTAENWYSFWYDRFNTTISELLTDFLKEHKISQITNIMRD